MARCQKVTISVLILLLLSCKQSVPESSGATFTFVPEQNGKAKAWSLADLQMGANPQIIEGYDPYYAKKKRFSAVSLGAIATKSFGLSTADLQHRHFVLRARDGYQVPMDGERLFEDASAYLAFQDVDVPGFEPIGPQKVSPAPFYLVWAKPHQIDLETHPRPWQLASIEMRSFESVYPHTVPPTEASALSQKGFRLFREGCIRCHAVNREGGRVGPDLNVPQNVLEYRPEVQVRAYIRNPRTFRYSNMPAHPHLTDGDLDALIEYFRSMKDQKFDPDRSEAK